MECITRCITLTNEPLLGRVTLAHQQQLGKSTLNHSSYMAFQEQCMIPEQPQAVDLAFKGSATLSTTGYIPNQRLPLPLNIRTSTLSRFRLNLFTHIHCI